MSDCFKKDLEKKFFVKIQSGKFKGKKLLLPSFSSTRSTKNRVKACVFDVLRLSLKEKIFIEVFAGSACMAIEALSNEALKVYGIEKDEKAYKIACKNAKSLNQTNIEILKGDAFLILPDLIKKNQEKIILYFDPPFEIRQGYEGIYQKIYDLIQNLDPNKIFIVVIEHYSQTQSPDFIAKFKKYKMKKLGSTSLSFYQ